MSDDRPLLLLADAAAAAAAAKRVCAGRSIACLFRVPLAIWLTSAAGAAVGVACLHRDGQPCGGPDVPSVQERAGAQSFLLECTHALPSSFPLCV